MSVTRIFEWICDYCGASASTKSYGLPTQWIAIPANMLKHAPVRQACECCKQKALEDELK